MNSFTHEFLLVALGICICLLCLQIYKCFERQRNRRIMKEFWNKYGDEIKVITEERDKENDRTTND